MRHEIFCDIGILVGVASSRTAPPSCTSYKSFNEDVKITHGRFRGDGFPCVHASNDGQPFISYLRFHFPAQKNPTL